MSASAVVDRLPVGSLRMARSQGGYRYALDPFLLCGFVRLRTGERVVDLGCGTGIIPLLLAETAGPEGVVGVEVQPELVACARKNVELNSLCGRVEIVQGDVRNLGGDVLLPGRFDVVVTNPPYRVPGRGRVAPDLERAACRHELFGGLRDFLRAAALLLRGKGRLYMIYLAERLPELLTELRQLQLEPKRMRLVHSRITSEARLVLVEARKGGRPGMQVEAPLLIYDGDIYTAEVARIFGGEVSPAEGPGGCG